MNEVNKYSRGIVADRNRLYWDEFRQMPSAFPPREEQTAIADYLDYNAALVARFIRTKRRQIELLTEQKRAVTESLLDSSRADLVALRAVCVIRLSGVDKHTHAGEVPIRLCNYTDVYKRDAITMDIDFMHATATASEIANFRLRRSDVLITKDSEDWRDIAAPAVVVQDFDSVLCGYHLAVLRPNPERLDGNFLFRCLTAPSINLHFSLAANGVTRYAISKDVIKSALIPLPPLTEQRTIVAAIERQVANIDQLIRSLHREIDLIREYRTRLIADLVTGQVDVRNAPIESVESSMKEIEPDTGPDEGDAAVAESEEVALADE
jgi:type I restriction enzyme S subunit